MLNCLYISSTSACFELANDRPYYAPEAYTVLLNGERVREGDTNVFSLFGLKPDTEYEVSLSGGAEETLSFRTKSERCALDVKAFGAKGDGVTDDTVAIQTAIRFLPEGGRLHFPAGIYLTFPLALKSHITLELAEGATLLGSTEREKYPIVPGTVPDLNGGEELHFAGFEGIAGAMYQSLITAEYAEDITLIGPGTVDGNAQNGDWWQKVNDLPAYRPRLCFFNRCKDIVMHGVHAQNSPSWQLHPYFSDHLAFYDVSVAAPKVSPNTDALDPESCDDVTIVGCKFTVGDDCVAIKSGKIELGEKFNKSADHHTIRNCLMAFGHGAVVLGSEIGAGVKNLSVSQCYFQGTDRGLRIKSRRGRGKNCIIDNVLFENIIMDGVLTPIVINLFYNCCDPDRFTEYVWSREHLPVDDRTPHMGRFHFKDMVCTGAQVAACYIDGLPESPIDEVEFENVSISFAEEAQSGVPAMQNFAEKRCKLGLYLDNVRSIKVRDVKLDGVVGDKLIAGHYETIDGGV